MLTCRVKLELEEVAAGEKSAGGADEEVVGMLRSESIAHHEANAGGSDGPTPTELWFVIMRTRQHEQLAQRLVRRVGNAHGRPPQLLQGGDKRRRIDRAEGHISGHRQIS